MKNIIIQSLFVVSVALVPAVSYGATASENWDQHCAKCHGSNGDGSTAMGKKLKVKDYTEAKALAGISDEQLTKSLVEGVMNGEKRVMNGYKDKMTDSEIKDLIALMRGWAKK